MSIKLSAAGYNILRAGIFGGRLSNGQVSGIENILTAINAHAITDYRYVAYMLATVFHETGKTMQPVEENGKGKSHNYGRKIKHSGQPYTTPDKLYYGRGLVQITWYENYQYLGKLVGADLLNHPEQALNPIISANIMIIGMTKGAFTGVKLSTYFNDTRNDAINARKIINGSDFDTLIASYHTQFLKALEVSN